VSTTEVRLPVASAAQVRRYALVLLRRHPGTLVGAVVLHVLATVAGLVAPRLVGGLVEDVERGVAASTVDRVALTLAVVLAAQTVLTRYARLVAMVLGEQVLAALREDFLSDVTALPLGTVEAAGTGDLLSRTTSDVEALNRVVRWAVPAVAVSTLTLALTAAATVLVSPLLALPCLLAVPVIVVATRWYLRRAPEGYRAEMVAWSRITDGLHETVEGARTVDALRLGPARVRRTDADIAGSWAAERYTLGLRTVFFPAVESAYVLPVVGALLFGGWMYAEGRASLGAVVAVTLYAQQLVNPVDELLGWLDELQVGGAALARLRGVAREADRDPGGRHPSGPDPGGPGPGPDPGARPDGEQISVRGVRYAYTPGHDVLRGVDLELRPGERLAVVGPSGAGKSTLGRLLAGISAPTAGSVTVGGVPVTDLPAEELRSHVVLVTQEHHVFTGTVADNLRLARADADDAALARALAAVDAEGWVAALPDGLGTTVGSGGHPVSPGQAQQLALARLVLADPHTLVLDEATAALDPRAARHLERSLAAVLEGRTVVAIAHRLSAAHDADRVAVMEDGRITEIGSHTALLAADGSYAALWRSWQS